MNLKGGFTLIELLVVIAVASFLILEAAYLFITIFSGSKQQYLSLDNVDNARIVASRFVNEIRSAVQGVDGSFAVSEAGDSEIIFYSPRLGPGTSIKRIRYFVLGNILYKGVVIPSGDPLSYDLESESISSVQPDLQLGGQPLFYYYNGDYDGTAAALSQPVNINNIRFVRINLVVLKQTSKDSDSTFSLSVGAAVRSLKDNLGE